MPSPAPLLTIHVDDRVRLRHGVAELEGVVVALVEDGQKAEVLVERGDGQEPLRLTRNVRFLTPVPRSS